MVSFGKTLLVTGGAGFIGSNFIKYILENYPAYQVVNFDKLTYAGDLQNVSGFDGDARYTFVKGDICDRLKVEAVFQEYQFSAVIHFAAESHVDNSIVSPQAFVETNVLGTAILLDVAKQHWSREISAVDSSQYRFVHVSTDEVYGSAENGGFFTEDSPLAPNSPYSASKAASDLMVRSYHQTFGLNVVITRCSNNFGPRQHQEKLIPTIIRRALQLENIPIYGDGTNIRDWLHVRDHCTAIDKVFHNGQAGEVYNIGAHEEHTNIEMATAICDLLDELAPSPGRVGSYHALITFVRDRLGHDKRYAVDSTKLRSALDWYPVIDFHEGLRETVFWYFEQTKTVPQTS